MTARDLIDPAAYGSNLDRWGFTTRAIGFLLALFPRYASASWPEDLPYGCVSLEWLEDAYAKPFYRAIQAEGWMKELDRRCDRVCAGSMVLHLTDAGRALVDAVRSDAGRQAIGALQPVTVAFETFLKSQLLARDVQASEAEWREVKQYGDCAGTKLWRQRVAEIEKAVSA